MLRQHFFFAPSACPAAIPAPSSNPRSYPLPDLSYADREALRVAGGCYHCRLTPSSPKWKPHNSRNCPADKSRNIPPRTPAALQNISTVTPATDSAATDFEEPELRTVTAIVREALIRSDEYQDLLASVLGPNAPSCVLGNGSFDSEDSYWD